MVAAAGRVVVGDEPAIRRQVRIRVGLVVPAAGGLPPELPDDPPGSSGGRHEDQLPGPVACPHRNQDLVIHRGPVHRVHVVMLIPGGDEHPGVGAVEVHHPQLVAVRPVAVPGDRQATAVGGERGSPGVPAGVVPLPGEAATGPGLEVNDLEIAAAPVDLGQESAIRGDVARHEVGVLAGPDGGIHRRRAGHRRSARRRAPGGSSDEEEGRNGQLAHGVPPGGGSSGVDHSR